MILFINVIIIKEEKYGWWDRNIYYYDDTNLIYKKEWKCDVFNVCEGIW